MKIFLGTEEKMINSVKSGVEDRIARLLIRIIGLIDEKSRERHGIFS